MASHLLTQLGADVVKIENPRVGDGNRGLAPPINGVGMFHAALSAGTRSLTVERNSPDWERVVSACARWADAVIVGCRPSDARARGLDFESLTQANQRLVYCLISGYGEEGPWRDYTSHGLNTDAFAGLVPVEWANGYPEPRKDYRSAGTTLAGIYAALGIMAGLYKRDHGGGAQYVGVSCWGAAMSWNWRDLTTYTNLGDPWMAYKDMGSRYCMYRTADDRAILVCPIERKFWEAFCDLVGLPEGYKAAGSWEASGMDNGADFPWEREQIAQRIVTRPLAEWSRVFAAASIPFAPVLDWKEALASEHARANGVMTTTTVAGKVVQIASSPLTVRGTDEPAMPATGEASGLGPPPALGEQTRELLIELGLGDLAGAR